MIKRIFRWTISLLRSVNLRITIEESGRIVVVHLEGDFYLGTLKDVENVWDKEIAKNPEVVAIDCTKLFFIDSPAIGTLVKFLNAASQSNIKLVFYNLNESIVRLFQRAKLNTVFTLTSREEFEQMYLKNRIPKKA